MDVSAINPEHLAYWYFRLNGFLTTVNFVVHPEEGAEQRTDVDLLGVRFPYRAELLREPMEDEPLFRSETKRPYFVIAEVKPDVCNLNGPWTRPELGNMHRVLTAVGAIPPSEHQAATEALYQSGVYDGREVFFTLCCIGGRENRDIRRRFPLVPQIRWPQITDFIFRRFGMYFDQKRSHPQWDECGQTLWKLFVASKSVDEFECRVVAKLGSR